ncbi:MAG: triphosphoribosyl-dephospho-CoA synthase CitG [Eubacteriales bacterium]|nr:triphosphoribosyl-dephospho-CoA synthase CitG [Eubacteriales bacterium]
MTGNAAAYSITYAAGGIAKAIGAKARRALLEEVYTTPKPGLVDLYSCGAHDDMDVRTFEKSAEALYPYFVRMAEQGYLLRCTPEALFSEIRKTGIEAEQAMYRATDGVNTHKGLIFTIGIFSAAAGRCMRENGKITARDLADMQIQMTGRILQKEIKAIGRKKAGSHGERNLQKYGTAGIRGEALAGYPGIWNLALPVLQAGIRERRDWNRVKLQTFFVLMEGIEDSNILARNNPAVLEEVQREAGSFLQKGGAYGENAIEKLCRMDGEYIRRNISAGGCADLLAAAVFIEMLLNGTAFK